MVRRDPQTGQFVSEGPGSGFDRWANYQGTIAVNVPAADLSGGQESLQFDTADAQLFDFTDVLDNDEVFVLQVLHMTADLRMGTTATAEAATHVGYIITEDHQDASPLTTRTTHIAGPLPQTDFTQGIVDGAIAQEDNDDIFLTGGLYAENSHSDTTNAVAAGAAPAHVERTYAPGPMQGREVAFDADDELFCLGELNIDNVSDHAVQFTVFVDLHGYVEELD